MALIKTVSPEQAEGKMKEAFDMFIETLGVIPKPLLTDLSPADSRFLTFGQAVILEFGIPQHHRIAVNMPFGQSDGFLDRLPYRQSTPNQSSPTGAQPHGHGKKFQIR